MKVCYFGIFDPNFTRSRVILKGLERNGVVVHVVNDRTPSWKKYSNLIKQHRALKGDYDAMLVGFPGYFTIFLARILTTKPIIFDAYISYYDGLLDRRSYSKFHPRAIIARIVDFFGVLCSAATLTINSEYKKFFVDVIHVSERKMHILRKGADTDIFYQRPQSTNKDKNIFTVGWWGTFIPLHGVEYIVEAAELLKGQQVKIQMIGRGQLKDRTANEILKRGLTNIELLAPVSYADLPAAIADFDLVLGLFGATPKSLRCVTNKVYEALALGKPVITEDSGANREIFTDKKDVFMIPPGDARALVDGIVQLKNDRALLATIAKSGDELFKREFTIEKIGANLVRMIQACLG